MGAIRVKCERCWMDKPCECEEKRKQEAIERGKRMWEVHERVRRMNELCKKGEEGRK